MLGINKRTKETAPVKMYPLVHSAELHCQCDHLPRPLQLTVTPSDIASYRFGLPLDSRTTQSLGKAKVGTYTSEMEVFGVENDLRSPRLSLYSDSSNWTRCYSNQVPTFLPEF